MKGWRADWHIVGIREFVRIRLFEIRLFEDRAKGNRRRGAQLIGLVRAAHNSHQGIGQFVVDNRQSACELSSDQPVRFVGFIIGQDLVE
jgi:hypothetical protein